MLWLYCEAPHECCFPVRPKLRTPRHALFAMLWAFLLKAIATFDSRHCWDFGGANEIRTHDLCSAIAALSQLSYGPFAPIYPHGASPVKASRCRPSRRFLPRAAPILPPVANLEAQGLGA